MRTQLISIELLSIISYQIYLIICTCVYILGSQSYEFLDYKNLHVVCNLLNGSYAQNSSPHFLFLE